jgi:hypothetical protein
MDRVTADLERVLRTNASPRHVAEAIDALVKKRLTQALRPAREKDQIAAAKEDEEPAPNL